MNETLKEHIELKANGTMAGKRFLHLDEINPDYNYAANTYLIALDELAAMQARIEKLETGLRRIIKGEYDNARTIEAAEKFARELLRGDK